MKSLFVQILAKSVRLHSWRMTLTFSICHKQNSDKSIKWNKTGANYFIQASESEFERLPDM